MSDNHEIIDTFSQAGLALNATLEAMLNEQPQHRTERRGCGFTQATRHVAARVNEPRLKRDTADWSLFAERGHQTIVERWLDEGLVSDWRHWDIAAPEQPSGADLEALDPKIVTEQADWQATLRKLPEGLERQESRLLASMMRDIVLPLDASESDGVELPGWGERLAVGSCPTAEKCYLELAHGFMPRKGRCNHLVDDHGQAVLIEKMNMGDDHSCISLVPTLLNGVRMPPGTLLAVTYDADAISGDPTPGPLRGQRIPIAECRGFRMLRLTTLAVDPAHRARAFSVHYEAQVQAGLFAPGTTELHQLRALTEAEAA